MLEALDDSIESLLRIEVGINISTKPSAYDVVLTADFDNEINRDKGSFENYASVIARLVTEEELLHFEYRFL